MLSRTEHPQKPLIIIGGGVGPMAGVELHRKIIGRTPNVDGDGDNLPIVHICRPAEVSDRSAWLIDGSGPNPGDQMAELVLEVLRGRRGGGRTIAAVPCNTFHSERIFSQFRRRLEAPPASGLKIIDMLDSTVAELKGRFSTGSRIGLLATDGTVRSGVWRSALEAAGFIPVLPGPEMQQRVHRLIYSPEWGLKAVYPPSPEAAAEFAQLQNSLAGGESTGCGGSCGTEAVILGCTELPLAAETLCSPPAAPLINPVDCLADALIAECLDP